MLTCFLSRPLRSNFTLPANEGAPITLSDFQGKKNVVLSFHIYSFTGG